MTQLQMVSKRPEFGAQMPCGVMAQFSGKPWIVPFTLFNAAVEDCPELLSERERLMWIKFESYGLLVLKTRPGGARAIRNPEQASVHRVRELEEESEVTVCGSSRRFFVSSSIS
jgi:hypothetical protein